MNLRKQRQRSWTTKKGAALLMLLSLLGLSDAIKTRLTWVNGIAHNLEHMKEGQESISHYFGGKSVEYCYNPTAMSHDDDLMGYAADLTQAGTQKMLGRITEEVNTLVAHLRDVLQKVGPRGKVIHIAHSQGALLTHLATKQLTPLEMNRIEVLAFGGAAVLRQTPTTPFSRVINYYAVNDPLLLVVPQAAQALASGFSQQKEEFCFLAPRVGDPIGDHDLLGLTYAQALEWEGKRFQSQYQTVLYRTTKFIVRFFVTLLYAMWLHCKRLFELTFGSNGAVNKQLQTYLLKPMMQVIFLFYFVLLHPVLQTWRHQQPPRYQPIQVALDHATNAKNTTKLLQQTSYPGIYDNNAASSSQQLTT